MNKSTEDLLREQCNRYVNGLCATHACLVRGGYVKGKGPSNYEMATCANHEAVLIIEEHAKCESWHIRWHVENPKEFCRFCDEPVNESATPGR